MLRLSLALVFLVVAPVPPARAHGPYEEHPVLVAAAEAWARDEPHLALSAIAAHVRGAAPRLADLAPDAAAQLADELEVLLVWAAQVARTIDDPAALARLLEGVAVAPEHGALWARLAWAQRAALEQLAPLVAWEFVGPFDNERGRGMTRPTAAEQDMGAASYPGKLREVAWRALPDVPPVSGVVRFDRLLHPVDQCCVVARSWVESDVERDALLVLGAAEELRVWVAGEAVYEALGEHSFAPDRACIPVRLAAGWTELVLKIGGQDDAPAFVARFAEPGSGAPLRLAQVAAPPAGVAPMALENPGRDIGAPRSVARPGAWARYADAEDAAGLFRRGLLEQDAQAAPRAARPGAAAITAACAAAPESFVYELQRLLSLRVEGAIRVEEDLTPFLTGIDRLLARRGDLPLLLRWKAWHASENQPTYERALALLERAIDVNPGSVPARFQRINVLQRMGQTARARAEAGALTRDPAIADWPMYALGLARDLPGADPRREQLIAAARDAGLAEAIGVAAADRRLRADDRSVEAVREVLAERLALDPWSVHSMRDAAELLIAMGHGHEALAVLDDALALCPERPALWRWRARAFLATGASELAAGALERELELDYTAQDEKRLLEHLNASGSAVGFHEPFRVPLPDVLARRAGDAPVGADVAGREVLLTQLVVEVNPDGTARRYRRDVERVLSDTGARELDRRLFRAWPGEEEIRLLTADVHRLDGSVDEGRRGRSGARGYVFVDLPPLAPGDIVDLEWRHDDLRTTFFGNYFGLDSVLAPDPRLPVRESELVLIVPAAFPLYLNQRAFDGDYTVEQRADGSQLHRWRLTDVQPRRSEPLMPPALESAPRVQASSYASWEDFGRWWWGLIADEIRVSPEMRAKVAELTAGIESPLEKLRAVYDFVVTDIRYNAWEFGVHGYEPYSAPVIYSRGFGDCKDKAILVRAMLSELDIRAWPVLIRMEDRRYEEDHELALVAHFNHCIAWVPEQDGIPEMFLDGTARYHPLGTVPDGDAGARVLIVRDDGVQQARVPFPSAEQNTMRHEIVLDLSGAGRPHVVYRRIPRGRFDPRERGVFGASPEERDEEAERLMTSYFGALAGEVEARFPDVEDLTRPIEVQLAAPLESVGRPTGTGLDVPTTFDRFELLRGLASESERTTDLLLDVPWRRETRIDYRLGADARPVKLPEPVQLETADARYERTVEATDDGVRIEELFELKTHRIPVARYAEFRALAGKVDDAQRTMVEVEVRQ